MPFRLPLSLAGSLRDDLVRGHREPRHLLPIAATRTSGSLPRLPTRTTWLTIANLLRRRGRSRRAAPPLRASNPGSHRDRRPAAADPLPRAQPRAAPANFSGWPSHPARGSRQKSPMPKCAQRHLSVKLSRGPLRQTRDRRGRMRLARCLGPRLSLLRRRRRGERDEPEPLETVKVADNGAAVDSVTPARYGWMVGATGDWPRIPSKLLIRRQQEAVRLICSRSPSRAALTGRPARVAT
jgi:hypothetical protein